MPGTFPSVPGQLGLIVFINGIATGVDLLSLSRAYARLHPKFIRSYALESLLEPPGADASQDVSSAAHEFLGQITAAQDQRFPAVGVGIDCRYRGTSLAGSALLYNNEVLHTACFNFAQAGGVPSEALAALSRRRAHFQRPPC